MVKIKVVLAFITMKIASFDFMLHLSLQELLILSSARLLRLRKRWKR